MRSALSSLNLSRFVLGAAVASLAGAAPTLTSYVDLRMGVQGTSNGVIGPQVPHGSVNPSPDTPDGKNGGYRPGQPVRGFSQLHVTGTGWGTYGQIFLSPQTGLQVGESDHDSLISGEEATPSYYAVNLDRYHIRTELAPTPHAVIYRFTFPQSDAAHLMLDLSHSLPENIAAYIKGRFWGGHLQVTKRADGAMIEGWGRYSGGFGSGAPYRVYFHARVDTVPARFGTWTDGVVKPDEGTVDGAGRIGGYVGFSTTAGQTICLKVGVSMRSIENARRFLDAEIPDFDFDRVRRAGDARWNDVLGRITLDGATDTQNRLFYTALYQSFLMPRDRTGDTPAWTSDLPYWDDQYATWDTWRTKFPLMILLQDDVVRDNVLSYIDRLEHNGRLNDAFVAGDDGQQQGGDDLDNIIAEAYVKHVPGIPWDRAYAVLRHDASAQRYPEYRERGWIPSAGDQDVMSCSKTLECAYNDYAAAQVARGLGRDDDYGRWIERSRQWEKLWNPDLTDDGFRGFIGPRAADGGWVKFDPKKNYGSWARFFYEGCSWDYSLFVPHDFARLIELSGGEDKFVARVEHALGHNLIELDNEPSFLVVRAFNYAGRPDRTAYWVHRILTEEYSLTAGYPGNEDSGAMASWYVFSAMGFFPNAGQDVYLINGPFCRKITVRLSNGRQLVIEGANASERNIYVQSVTLNGKSWDRDWFTHDAIKDGGVLRFVMGPEPSDWARQAPRPPSFSRPSVGLP